MANPNLPVSGKYNTYIGARYVPLMGGEWNQQNAYEPLVIVTYQGNSYTSNTFVPAGTDINNTTYWTLTGNYNGQVAQYREEVQELQKDLTGLQTDVDVLTKGLTTANSNIEVINDKIKSIYGTPVTSAMDIILYTDGGVSGLTFTIPITIDNRSLNYNDFTTLPKHKNMFFLVNADTHTNISEIVAAVETAYESNGGTDCNYYVMISPNSTNTAAINLHSKLIRSTYNNFTYCSSFYPMLCNTYIPSQKQYLNNYLQDLIIKYARKQPSNLIVWQYTEFTLPINRIMSVWTRVSATDISNALTTKSGWGNTGLEFTTGELVLSSTTNPNALYGSYQAYSTGSIILTKDNTEYDTNFYVTIDPDNQKMDMHIENPGTGTYIIKKIQMLNNGTLNPLQGQTITRDTQNNIINS